VPERLSAASSWQRPFGAAPVRHLAILAALALTACTLPGLSSGNSFMSSMHPTQEFCASRGMTLDPATKQCTTPPQSTPPAAETTGSLPQGAQKPAQPQSPPGTSTASPAAPASVSAATSAQPPPPERQRPGEAAPVEPDAVIHADLKGDFDLMSELTHFVRASGYRCDSISALAPLAYTHGYKLVCNHFNYKYAIEEKDGRSSVTVQ